LEEEEASSTPLNVRQEEAKVLKILQRRLAQVAEERQTPEIPTMPDLHQPTLMLTKVKKNPLSRESISQNQ